MAVFAEQIKTQIFQRPGPLLGLNVAFYRLFCKRDQWFTQDFKFGLEQRCRAVAVRSFNQKGEKHGGRMVISGEVQVSIWGVLDKLLSPVFLP